MPSTRDERRWSWDEWERCALHLGLTVRLVPLGGLLGCLVGSVLAVERELARPARALVAWHELAHVVLHAGSADAWAALPGGRSLLGRFERQAWRFALCVPQWDPETLAEALAALTAVPGGAPAALRAALEELDRCGCP